MQTSVPACSYTVALGICKRHGYGMRHRLQIYIYIYIIYILYIYIYICIHLDTYYPERFFVVVLPSEDRWWEHSFLKDFVTMPSKWKISPYWPSTTTCLEYSRLSTISGVRLLNSNRENAHEISIWKEADSYKRVLRPKKFMRSSFLRLLDHTQRLTTVGRTPLDEWSAHRPDLSLTTHMRQTTVPLVGFEPTISAGKRPQTYALDCAATGNDSLFFQ